MRRVATLAFTSSLFSPERARELTAKVGTETRAWLAAKGRRDAEASPTTIRLADGRLASLAEEHLVTSVGELWSWSLDEPMQGGGRFRTTLELAAGEHVGVQCSLDAGHAETHVAPLRIDTRVQKVVRSLLRDTAAGWNVRGTPAQATCLRRPGRASSAGVRSLIFETPRALPVVLVSETYGFMLHPDLDEALANDLAGVALVASIDEEAAWGLTALVGPDWSCYHGAVRVYWPGVTVGDDPFRHPRWTTSRLMMDGRSMADAASVIRQQLGRRILGLASLSVRPLPMIGEIREAAQSEALSARIAEAKHTGDYRELFEESERDNRTLKELLRASRERLAEAEAELEQAQVQLAWKRGDLSEDVLPHEVRSPPTTVAEAVERARGDFGDALLFGADVEKGVGQLDRSSGPPDKIYSYLQGLADMSRHRITRGELGALPVAFLQARNFDASGESYTVENNADERRRRTWDDGDNDRVFLLHLKPAEGVAPNRCVRIYFDWSEARKRYVIGWIGPHP